MANSEPHSDNSKRDGNAFAKIKALGEKLIHSKHMLWGIGLASFLESIIVPIPLEAILIPLMQVKRRQLFAISAVALLGCMLGATVGYAVGYFVFDLIGNQLVNWISTPEQFEQVKQKMNDQGFWFIFSVGVVPIPFQIAMLAAGATKYSLMLFLLASALSRAIRYFGLALLVYFAGNKAQEIFEQHKTSTSLILLAIIATAWGFAIWG